MKMTAKRWAMLILVLTPPWGAPSQEVYSPRTCRIEITWEGGRGPYSLPDELIIGGTVRVSVDGRALTEGKDYQVVFENGLLFESAVSVGATILVEYERLPIRLRRSFFHRQREPGKEPAELPEPAEIRESERSSLLGKLRLGGSKTLGLSLGSENGLSLDQSLRLSISGTISPGVEIIALLSDQSTPLQAEGTTQTLEELDKVLVEVRGENLSATLGDYYLSHERTEFANYQRKLQGVQGTARWNSLDLRLSGAISRGEYTNCRFLGTEGKQGPYRLRGKNGEVDIVVLAGTERVWVDGERMVRGENNDYTIEYGRGTVTFTERRLITGESRISVDYEYSAQEYGRSFYFGEGVARMGMATISTSVIIEADDPDDPLGSPLTAEDREILRAAGNHQELAWKDGAVEAEDGEYNLATDSLGNSYFVFAGPDSGSHRVHFSWVGEGQGSYKYRGGGAYEYVSPGQGDYEPLVFLPLPERHFLSDLRLELRPSSVVEIAGELAFSHRDRNVLSGRDDGENLDGASAFRGALRPRNIPIGKLRIHGIDLQAWFRRRGDNFSPFERVDEVEHGRKWDIPSEMESSSEKIYLIQGSISPIEGMTLGSEVGRLNLGRKFRSRRAGLNATLRLRRLPHLDVEHEEVDTRRNDDTNGQWIRDRGEVSIPFAWITPRAGFQRERRERWSETTLVEGEGHGQVDFGVRVAPWRKLLLSSSFSRRKNRVYEGRWLAESIARTSSNELKLQELRGWACVLEYTKRLKEHIDVPGADNDEDLARVEVSYLPPKGWVAADGRYQINSAWGGEKVRTYLKVEEGEGEYRLQNGEYIPAEDGDYILVVEEVGEEEPVTQVTRELNLDIRPHELVEAEGGGSSWRRILSSFRTETYLLTEERSVGRRLLLGGGATISNHLSLRQDVYLFPLRRDFNLRLRYVRTCDRENQQSEDREERLQTERALRLNIPMSTRITLQMEYSGGRRIRESSGRPDHDVRLRRGMVEISYHPTPGWELTLGSEIWRDQDLLSEDVAHRIGFSPALSRSLSGRGRARIGLQWSRAIADQTPRWPMLDGMVPGDSYRWTTSLDYRFHRSLTASASYTGKSEPGRKTRHLGQAEMRAYF